MIGSCASVVHPYYYQLENTWEIVPENPTTWDADYTSGAFGTLSGSLAFLCPMNLVKGGGSVSCTAWEDYDTVSSLGVFGTLWTPVTQAQFQDTTAGNTHVIDFEIVIVTQPLSINPVSGTPVQTVQANDCKASPESFTGSGTTDIAAAGDCAVLLYVPDGFAWTATGTQYEFVFVCLQTTCSTFTDTYYQVPVTQAIELNVSPYGAPTETFTLSGCSVSPSSVTGDGGVYVVTATPSCSITITGPSSANTRAVFRSGSNSMTFSTCALGGCSAEVATYYYQLQNTFQVTPSAPTIWDQAYSVSVPGTALGMPATLCSTMITAGGGSASCAGWGDYGDQASLPYGFGSYYAQGPVSFNEYTGGNTLSVAYDIEGAIGPIVQTCANTVIGAQTVSCTLSSSVTSGNAIVVEAIDVPTPSIADSFGDQFTEVASVGLPGSAYSIYFFSATASTSGSDAISVSGTGSDPSLLVHELSGGLTSLAAFSTGTGSSSNPAVASYSPPSGSYVIAGVLIQNSLGVIPGTVGAGPGYTLVVSGPGYSDESAAGTGSPTASQFQLSGSLDYAEVSVAFAQPVRYVTEPLTLTINEGGVPTTTFSLSGCGVSPTSIAGDGTAHPVTAVASCQVTITAPAASSNSQFVFGRGYGASEFTTCGSDLCSGTSISYYYQLLNTYGDLSGVTDKLGWGVRCGRERDRRRRK